MTHPIRKATLIYPDGSGQSLTLLKLREKAYKWSKREPSGAEVPYDDAEHTNIEQAVKALRVACEADPRKPDLTVMGCEDAAQVRAARRIEEAIVANLDFDTMDSIAEIIAEETNSSNLCAALNGLLTHLMSRLGVSDPALNPILLEAVVQLEKATKEDYTNIKKRLSEAISQVQHMVKLVKEQGLIGLH
jgi:hypothetical protein